MVGVYCLHVVLYAKESPFLCCSDHVVVVCELLAYLCCHIYIKLVMWHVVDRGWVVWGGGGGYINIS
jgi:hypothetical protein